MIYFSKNAVQSLKRCVSMQVRLLMDRDPNAKHEVFQTRDVSAALVALMNLVFAYGMQVADAMSLQMPLNTNSCRRVTPRRHWWSQ